jgi:Fic family protein
MIILESFHAGFFRQAFNYKYFMPSFINDSWQWSDTTIAPLLEQASFHLGQLNAFARLVPNIDLFIHLHITKEAVVSSKIEGTQTHFDEALLPEESINPERKDDWQEVQNYTWAMNDAILRMHELPISSRMLLHTHHTLMQGVRGEKKTPGEFRRSQNWIGGISPSDAVFVPPHHDAIPELISDWEHFLHNDSLNVPILLKAAIMHYQFETIHPFLDGNGRIGRLLITLFLMENKVLDKPLLYLSSYFESDRQVYYENLMRVRTHNEMIRWIHYFLQGISQTAQKAVETLQTILALKHQTEEMIQSEFGRRIKSGLDLHRYMIEHPVVSIRTVEETCGLSSKAAGDLVALFVQKGLLKEFTGQTRNRMFVYEPYLNAFERV